MIDSPAQRQPNPNSVMAAKSSPGKVAIMPESARTQDIRERAYELYESRGCQPGKEEQDWFRAEQELHKQR
jgi:hypothetical protein